MHLTSSAPEADVPLNSVDLYDTETYRSSSQEATWRTLRARAPMFAQQAPDGSWFWSVTRYADVAAVLKDHARFGSEHGTILAVTGGDPAGGRTINLMDPPGHTEVRVPSFRMMSFHAMRQRRAEVRDNVRRIVSACFREGGVHDFARISEQLPMAAVGEIMGIPRRFWASIPRWTMAGVAPDDPFLSLGSTRETLQTAHHNLFALFSELIEHRRRHPGDDLISVLLRLEVGGGRMDDQRVLLNCYSFVMGASTTTPHVASQMLLALIGQPAAWCRIRAQPELIRTAVEEALRWASPTNHLMRQVLVPVQLGDVSLDKGDLVCAWVASANRDDSVFSEPYVFEPARSPNPHLAFGLGAHRCIGGPAAQVVLRLLLEEMVAGLEGFELAGQVSHLASNFINGVTSLPVALHPRSAGRYERLASIETASSQGWEPAS